MKRKMKVANAFRCSLNQYLCPEECDKAALTAPRVSTLTCWKYVPLSLKHQRIQLFSQVLKLYHRMKKIIPSFKHNWLLMNKLGFFLSDTVNICSFLYFRIHVYNITICTECRQCFSVVYMYRRNMKIMVNSSGLLQAINITGCLVSL